MIAKNFGIGLAVLVAVGCGKGEDGKLKGDNAIADDQFAAQACSEEQFRDITAAWMRAVVTTGRETSEFDHVAPSGATFKFLAGSPDIARNNMRSVAGALCGEKSENTVNSSTYNVRSFGADCPLTSVLYSTYSYANNRGTRETTYAYKSLREAFTALNDVYAINLSLKNVQIATSRSGEINRELTTQGTLSSTRHGEIRVARRTVDYRQNLTGETRQVDTLRIGLANCSSTYRKETFAGSFSPKVTLDGVLTVEAENEKQL